MELTVGRHYLVNLKDGTLWDEYTYKGYVNGLHEFVSVKEANDMFRIHTKSLDKDVKDIPIDNTKGFKYDGDKKRWDLLPWSIIEGVVTVLSYGAKKYADNNWMNVPNGRKRYFAAMMRHLIASEEKGEDTDPESGIDHLFHALCCLVFITYFKLKEKREIK